MAMMGKASVAESAGMFKIARKESIAYLECVVPGERDFCIHAFCTRQGGVSGGAFASLNVSAREGDGNDEVRRNFERIAAAFGIAVSQFLLLHQVHRDDIWVVGEGEAVSGPLRECDAVVTDRPGTALCIKTADCAPVFLADPVRRIVGAVHAGWKGTALQIVKKTVEEMTRRFDVRPPDLFAFIGPAIGPCCYEVDAAVYSAMRTQSSCDALFSTGKKAGKWMFDLSLANRLQLLEAGLPPKQIFATGRCTACHPELFFSHRAQSGNTGRQLNFIMIRELLSKGHKKNA
jgi:hypothetical protein